MSSENGHLPTAFVVLVKHGAETAPNLHDSVEQLERIRGLLDRATGKYVTEYYFPNVTDWQGLMGGVCATLARQGLYSNVVGVQALLGRSSEEDILASIRDGTHRQGRAGCVTKSSSPAYNRWLSSRK